VTAVTAGRPARLRVATGAQARWTRPALGILLTATALLYLAGLSRNGWANDFYSAAVQAGARSWKAFFFGSFDASNFITVDKTPASLWVMELSARLFGLNYWSVLVPQALEGVGSVALLYGAVRRWFGPGAGLLAGSALALTPVATLMFRFNNPDALLVLLMTGAAYGVVRAIESGRTRWLVLAGALLGFGFLTKMLQAFLLLPAFGIAYLVAGPPRLGVRIWQLLAGLAAVIAGAGWWVAAVMLTPAADRPYIGGSTSNSILQLTLGYNGLGRIDGNETGSVGFTGNRGGSPAFSGPAGLGRLFASEMGGQISWLLPAALLAVGALAWLSWHARRGAGRLALAPSGAGPGSGPVASGSGRRTDVTMAAVLLWGGWLVVTGAVFSFMAGIIHPYYTVALAPAIAALVGIGAVRLWHARDEWPARALLSAGVVITAGWSYALLDRSPTWYPPLRFAVVIVGFGAAAVLLTEPWLTGRTGSETGGTSTGDGRGAGHGRARGRGLGLGRVTLAGAAATAALIAALAGPAAYSLDAAATAHTGALPTAGPTVTSSFGGPGGGGAGGPGGAGGHAGLPGAGRGIGSGSGGRSSGQSATGTQPPGFGSSGSGSSGIGGSGRASGTGSGTGRLPGASTRGGSATGRQGGFPGGGQGKGGGGGGLGGSTQVSKALIALLERNASAYTWAAATVGSESAAPLQLATGQPVMSIGGFNGTDPSLSLAQFKRLVAEHKIHYFVGANSDSFGGGSGDAAAISTWVTAHFKSQTVGGETVYNLAGATSAG
jgi:4-amino-4-deoxy-L-arabinose transferase-like glycosyltransferase